MNEKKLTVFKNLAGGGAFESMCLPNNKHIAKPRITHTTVTCRETYMLVTYKDTE